MKTIQEIPEAQKAIIQKALASLCEELKKEGNLSESYEKFDATVLHSLLNYKVFVEFSEKELNEFTSKNGVDFPMYSISPEKSKSFPNGFDSWQETHYEISSEIKMLSLKDDDSTPLFILGIEDKSGQGGLYELAIELTDKFEALYKGVDWDGDFFDTLEEFLNVEIYK